MELFYTIPHSKTNILNDKEVKSHKNNFIMAQKFTKAQNNLCSHTNVPSLQNIIRQQYCAYMEGRPELDQRLKFQ